jgi:hypothetical protein
VLATVFRQENPDERMMSSSSAAELMIFVFIRKLCIAVAFGMRARVVVRELCMGVSTGCDRQRCVDPPRFRFFFGGGLS